MALIMHAVSWTEGKTPKAVSWVYIEFCGETPDLDIREMWNTSLLLLLPSPL